MSIWIVYVVAGSAGRYIDSQWGSESAAVRRKADLESYFAIGGNGSSSQFQVYIKSGRVEDVAVVDKTEQRA